MITTLKSSNEKNPLIKETEKSILESDSEESSNESNKSLHSPTSSYTKYIPALENSPFLSPKKALLFKKEKVQQDIETPKKKTIIKREFKNRLNVRYCCAFFIPLSLICIFLCLYLLTKSTGEFSYNSDENTGIYLEMDKCLLYLNQKTQNNTIEGSYALSYNLMALIDSTLQQSTFNTILDQNQLNISAISSSENDKTCSLYLNIPPISNFTIKCFSSCYIIQEYNNVEAKTFSLTSEGYFYSNFRRIEVDDFAFHSEKGVLQLNSFLINKKASIDLKYGDIVLQSEKDLQINWKNEQQTFCFASPFVEHQDINDCALAEDKATSDKANLTTCNGKTTVCATKTCDGAMPTLEISQSLGNLYINRVDDPFQDIEYMPDYQTSNGLIYTNGVAFEPNVIGGIDEIKKESQESGADQIFIIEMGKKILQSRKNGLWTVVSNPSYAYIRPWWLSVFSLSLLTGNFYEVSGYLSPGFCPYHIQHNLQEIYETQNYLKEYFELNNSVVSFVNPDFYTDPTSSFKNGTGFFDFKKGRPSNENWISVNKNEEGQLQVVDNNIDKNKFIFVSLILSFLFAALVGATILFIFKSAIMITYKEILEKTKHCTNYINLIKTEKQDENKQPEKKKFNLKGILEETSFSNFMKEVPRLSAFIGFYSSILMKKYMINSVDQFLNFLMNPNLTEETEKANKGLALKKYTEMKEKDLKNYYEKFCFINGLIERQLSEEENLKKFKEYGFDLVDDVENLSRCFTFMQIDEKKIQDSKINIDSLGNYENSLDFFIDTFVTNTKSETDTEFLDDFIEKYENFCSKWRLAVILVRADKIVNNIKYKFGSTKLTRKKLVRNIMSQSNDDEEHMKKEGFLYSLKIFFMKIVTFGKYVEKSSLHGKFLIDEMQLNYHFNVILNYDKEATFEGLEIDENEKDNKDNKNNKDNKDNKVSKDNKDDIDKKDEQDKQNQNDEKDKKVKKDEKIKKGDIDQEVETKKSVIHKMIYQSYWYYWFTMDASTIFLHQIIIALCVLPFFFLVLLQEISYSPFSIIDPDYLTTRFIYFIFFQI